jgi:hypothetical protein
VHFAPGTVAAKKSGLVRWALTLAGQRRQWTCDIGRVGLGDLGLATTLGAATSVAPALVAAFLLAVGSLSIASARLPLPPPPCLRTALGATVSCLGVPGLKRLLAPLE